MGAAVNGHATIWVPSAATGPQPAGDAATDRLVAQLREHISTALQHVHGSDLPSEQQRREHVEELLHEGLLSYAQAAMQSGAQPMDTATEHVVARRVRDALLGLGPLQPLIDDPDIENIDMIGADGVWVSYTDGRRSQLAPLFVSDEDLEGWVRRLAAHSPGDERRFDRGSPAVSVRLPDGSRLFAVMSVAARTSVSIRRHQLMQVSLAELVEDYRALSPAMAGLLTAVVRARRNIVVAGGTNTGKTTFLRALAAAIGPYERLVTVEDAFELGLDRDPGHPNTVALQSRAANLEGVGAVRVVDLTIWALRMNPDRLIVGEVRGDEVIPMLNAMSQGNDGSMATVHASSSQQAFTRLATYAAQGAQPLGFEASAMLLGGAVHVVVHLAWASDGRRVVSSIREVTGTDGQQVTSNEIYRPGPDGRGRYTVPLREATLRALTDVGFDPGALDADRDGWR